MRFGKYRGRPLRELPDDYLEWLTTLELLEPLRTHVEAEYRRRFASRDATADVTTFPAELRDVAARLIGRGFRALAAELHPDAGGDHDAMVALNRVHEVLRALVRQPEHAS